MNWAMASWVIGFAGFGLLIAGVLIDLSGNGLPANGSYALGTTLVALAFLIERRS